MDRQMDGRVDGCELPCLPMCRPMPILQAIMLSLAMRSRPFRDCLLLSRHTNTVFCTALKPYKFIIKITIKIKIKINSNIEVK